MIRLPVDFYPALPFELVEPKAHDPGCQDCKLGFADAAEQGGLERAVAERRRTCIQASRMRATDPEAKRGRLLLVGDPPGHQERANGEHMVGVVGMISRQIARKHWPGEVVVSGALRCSTNGAEVTETMHRACRPYLLHEVETNGVDRIVCVGNQAAKAVLGHGVDPVSVRHGYAFTSTKIPVFVVINPANHAPNRFLKRWHAEDLAWACSVPLADLVMPPADATAHVIETLDDCWEVRAALLRTLTPAFDFETFGSMGDHDFRALTCAVSPDPANAYVWDEAYIGPLRDSGPTDLLKRWLADTAPKCGQNVPYDIRTAAHGLGVTTRGVCFDSRLARKMIQADADADLETMAMLVGVSSPKGEVTAFEASVRHVIAKVTKLDADGEGPSLEDVAGKVGAMTMADLGTTVARLRQRPGISSYVKAFLKASHPGSLRARYCASDAMITTMLRRRLEPELRADPGLAKVHDEVVVPLIHGISMMMIEGLPIDADAVGLLDQAMAKEILEAQAEVAVHGDVNLNNAKDVGDFLFKRLKIPQPKISLGKKRPKTNQPSTAHEVLEKIDHPAAKAILKYRGASKFKSTYAEGMLQFVRDDGKVHPDFLLDGTETGRGSSKNPNAYNIPRANTPRGKMCRDIFVAPEGWTLVEVDQNQGEIRGAGMLSGDPDMIAIIAAGHDFHLAAAKQIAPLLGVDPEIVTKEHKLRSHAKNGVFAVIYGKAAENLATQLGISAQDAERVIDSILNGFPTLKAKKAELLRLAKVTGSVRVPWAGGDGRLRPLWRIGDVDGPEKGTAERSSLNTPIQGLCAEFTNASIGALQRWIEEECFPAKLVLTVYDSIIALVKDGCVDEYVRNAQRVCTQWYSYGVPLKWDDKVGKAWGSLIDYKEPA